MASSSAALPLEPTPMVPGLPSSAPTSSSLEPVASTRADDSAPVGGPWVTCYAHFRPESTVARDTLRLGMLCGPSNGMKALGVVQTGAFDKDNDTHEHDVLLKRGECVRAFAVAERSVAGFQVALIGPTGEVLATEQASDRWPVLQADRPVCVATEGTYKLRVRNGKGTGAYAVQGWRLP